MGYNDKYEIIWLVSDPGKFRHLNYKNVKFVTAENRYGWNSCRAYYYAATARYFSFSHNTRIFWTTGAREDRSSICGMAAAIRDRSRE